jgi:hypothetical protein
MGLWGSRPGKYFGLVYGTLAGWVVSVQCYEGQTQEGHQWSDVPGFFRVDLLLRQLAEAGIRVQDIRLQGNACVIKLATGQGREGPLLKRFMEEHYPYGAEQRRISWSWGVRQYN